MNKITPIAALVVPGHCDAPGGGASQQSSIPHYHIYKHRHRRARRQPSCNRRCNLSGSKDEDVDMLARGQLMRSSADKTTVFGSDTREPPCDFT